MYQLKLQEVDPKMTAEDESEDHGVFAFVDSVKDSVTKINEQLKSLKDEVNFLGAVSANMKDEYLPQQFAAYRQTMVDEIVAKVVEETGGPVTEVKVYNMIQEKRESDICSDIKEAEKRMKSFVNYGVCKDLERHV